MMLVLMAMLLLPSIPLVVLMYRVKPTADDMAGTGDVEKMAGNSSHCSPKFSELVQKVYLLHIDTIGGHHI